MSAAESKLAVVCQQCLQPIFLDNIFENKNVHALAFSNNDVNNLTELIGMSFDETINSTNAIKYFTNFVKQNPQTSDDTLKARTNSFHNLLFFGSIDHSLCDECTDTLIDFMDDELKIAHKDSDDYNIYLQKIGETDESLDIEMLGKTLADLEDQEQLLLEKLANLQSQEEALHSTISLLEQERDRERDRLNVAIKKDLKLKKKLELIDDETCRLDSQLTYAKFQLDKLKKTNIWNVTFDIWYAGDFGIINNFRLGQLPLIPVDWSEINAAFGQAILLLSALARKLNFTFDKYRLVPFGNHSYIEVIGKRKELPLYGKGGGFQKYCDNKFDAAMVAFLDCMIQFKDKIKTIDEEFNMPYHMVQGKIGVSQTGDFNSIKIQFNSEERWTKGLKHLLTNLDLCLTWVSLQLEITNN